TSPEWKAAAARLQTPHPHGPRRPPGAVDSLDAMILGCEAPAKINRELRVGARRRDGYHAIFSRFTTLDLADLLEAEAADSLFFSCSGEPSPLDESNLVLRAARALAERLTIPATARINLTKRI